MNIDLVGGDLRIRAGPGGFRVLIGTFPYGKTAPVKAAGKVRKEKIGPNAFGWQIQKFKELNEELTETLSTTFDEFAAYGKDANIERIQEQLERRNIHILRGHNYDHPLGDMKKGTARVTSNADEVRFEVDLPDEIDMSTYMRDTVLDVQTGRAGGVSPGFRVPPRNVVPNAEVNIPEPGNPGVFINQVNQAVLHELSIVTRPAYGSTELNLRADDFEQVQDLKPRSRKLWLFL